MYLRHMYQQYIHSCVITTENIKVLINDLLCFVHSFREKKHVTLWNRILLYNSNVLIGSTVGSLYS